MRRISYPWRLARLAVRRSDDQRLVRREKRYYRSLHGKWHHGYHDLKRTEMPRLEDVICQ